MAPLSNVIVKMRIARGGRRRRRRQVLLAAREQTHDVDARAVNIALPVLITRSDAAATAATTAAVWLQCDRIRSGSDCIHEEERHCRAIVDESGRHHHHRAAGAAGSVLKKSGAGGVSTAFRVLEHNFTSFSASLPIA